jgi:hypothetical protein
MPKPGPTRPLVALLATVSLSGCATTAGGAPTPVPVTTTTYSATGIPQGVFLQPTDPGQPRTDRDELTRDDIARALPMTCGETFASDSAIVARRGRSFIYDFDPTPDTTPTGTVDEVLTTYRAGGAMQYLADVRRAAGRCPAGGGRTDEKYVIVNVGFGGDESLLLSHEVSVDYGQLVTIATLTAVVRRGDLVGVVAVNGWESNSPVRADADLLIGAALAHLPRA